MNRYLKRLFIAYSYFKRKFINHIYILFSNTILHIRLILFTIRDRIGIGPKNLNLKREFLDRLELRYINPQKIKYYIEIDNTQSKGYFIQDGNWDLKKKNLIPTFCIQFVEVQQLLVENRDIEETTRYKKFLEEARIKKLDKDELNKTIEWYTDYCKGLRRVYESIKNNGYKRQDEIKKDVIDRKRQEINISIDRWGNSLFEFPRGGTHRFAIAKMLELERIPVIIRRIHYFYYRKKNLHFLHI